MNDLELVTTGELVEELRRRFQGGVVLLNDEKKNNKSMENMAMYWWGGKFQAIGMAGVFVKEMQSTATVKHEDS